MKIGIIGGIPDPTRGGVYTFQEEIISSLLRYASSCKHRFVIFPSSNNRPQDFALPSNVDIVDIFNDHKRESLLSYASKALDLLKEPHRFFRRRESTTDYAKLIHDKLVENEIDLLWHIELNPLFNEIDIPYLVTIWDLQHRLQPYFPEVSSNGEWQAREHLFEKLIKRAAFTVSGTNCGKSEIMQLYQIPSERIRVIPMPTPGTSLSSFNEDIPLPDRYRGSDPYLYYPAQFWPHKNHIVLLLAVKLLHKKYGLNFRLFFTGSDQGNKSYVEHMVKELELTEQIKFLGFVSEKEKIALYKHAFALTFPTFFGPDNIPPLEAFALGCPVIASQVQGAEEQLDDAALLFDPKEPSQLAEKIKMLHERADLREELIRKGRERAIRFTGKEYVEGIFAILDEFEPFRRCWSSKEGYRRQ